MNINFNQIIKNFTPFFILFLVAYLLNSILYIYLPKKPKINIQKINYDVEYAKYRFNKNFKEKIVVKKEPIKKKPKNDFKLISNIILKAVYSTSSNGGWIIIAEKKSSKTHILSIGDIFKDYKLKLIYNDYVIFSKHGKEYKLAIKSDNKKVDYTIKNVSEKNDHIALKNIDKKITETDDGFILKRNLINSYTKNLSKIWREINIQDHKTNGQLDGFIIKSISSKSIFNDLGLRRGDIIKKVNNIMLKSYADAFNVYKKLGKTNNLNFVIIRDNEEMELEYEIK